MKTTEQNLLYCINTGGWLLPRDNQAHTTRLIFWWVVTSFIQEIFSEQILLVDMHLSVMVHFHGFIINKSILSDDWSLFYLETKYCNMSEDAERLINLYLIKSHLYLTFIRTEYIFNIKHGKLSFYCIWCITKTISPLNQCFLKNNYWTTWMIIIYLQLSTSSQHEIYI